MTEAANPDDSADRAARGSSPHRTYAVVVGIESYDAGADWDLEGPAEDAIRFTSWLSGRGVPADHILVFLSPLDGAPSADILPSGVTVTSARREFVDEAITRALPEWEGDLLWLFWAGHGVLTREDHLRLLYADASTNDKRNLDVYSLLTSLRSDQYPGLSRVVGVFDACQIYAERLQFAATLPPGEFAYGAPLPGREQFVLFATGPGQVAVNLGRTRGGLFTRILLEELARLAGDDWPPDMGLVTARLVQRFSELREMGQIEQVPTMFRWRPWAGGEHVLSAPLPSAGARSQTRAAGRQSRPRYLVAANDQTPTPTASSYEQSLHAVAQALDRIRPGIFRDPRIATEALSAASAAIDSLPPIIKALTAAATKETDLSARFELQQLAGGLRRHKAAVSDKLAALSQAGSVSTAEPLCGDLAREGAGLLAAGAEAARRLT